ncbi:hypothetical protein CLOP_g12296 [Closterium sp. NIES-67]|nr:hypothetical protein CLOP_g12296 [Closterium sp. NIES-67]
MDEKRGGRKESDSEKSEGERGRGRKREREREERERERERERGERERERERETCTHSIAQDTSRADPSLFLRTSPSPFYILVYVDDMILITADSAELERHHPPHEGCCVPRALQAH